MVVNISESVSVKHATKPILARSDDITVTLPCDFTTATYETPQITWYQEKAGHRKEIMQYDIHNRLSSYGEFVNRVTRGDRGALVILRPSPRDSWNYSCEVEVDNETPSWVKTSVELLVEEEPLTTIRSTADSTERTPKQTEDVKGELVFFIAILWMVPTVCSFIFGKKGFHRCKETHRNLRTKTLRQIFTLGMIVFIFIKSNFR
ncbi:uncharacterized protein LOC135481663 [Liolophura sinensis]|uniref:uncharacterized protein LOC135481663 n=1 Tax=Liolophura sinensis TaxID=3198878 RepID=UPI0031584359